MKLLKKNIFFILLIPLFCQADSSIWHREDRWDWSKINLDDATFWQSLDFPKNFQWGCATSAMQIEGVQTHDNMFVKNNWTEDPKMQGEFVNHKGSDHWNRYKEDVALIEKAHLNSYRFSISWEKIEPCMGIYDEVAMQHYKDLVQGLKKKGIEPWVCLFHFTIPVWFDQLGGFEKEENIIHFIKFCKYVFDNLGDQINFWAIYNEPSAYVLEAYFRGTYPPHISHPAIAGEVMKNMLKAHVEIYKAFKKENNNVQIGLIKMFHPIDPYNAWNPLERFFCKVANILLHDTVLDYFKTGKFNWLYLVTDENNDALAALDFIGVNYYAHELLQCGPIKFRTIKIRKGETKIPDKNQGIYAEGLYRAIAKAAELKLPIYISENGIADHTDELRNEFIKQHLYVVQKALDEGYNILGYHYWTLMDSLGWRKNYNSKYGFYAVDTKTMERKLRNGAKPFVNFLETQKHKWS